MSAGTQTTGPQRMKANWRVVETKCPACQGPFTFGEEVCQCMHCGSYHHSGCWDSSGGCTHPAAAAAIPTAMPPPPPPVAYFMPPSPPAPLAYGMQPLPMQPQALAPDEQYCPRCANIVKTYALSCRFCNSPLSYGPPAPMFGQQPYGVAAPGVGMHAGMRPDLESRASGARNCGLIGLICCGVQLVFAVLIFANAREISRDSITALMLPLVLLGLTAIVLGIVGIVKGNGVKRILDQFPHDPTLRSRANAGVVMGWIVSGNYILGIVLNIVRAASR